MTEAWHGTYGGYCNHRCKCDRCTEANRLYFRPGNPGHAARRRYQARLVAQGLTTSGKPRTYPYKPRPHLRGRYRR